MHAAHSGNADAVNALAELGANVNGKDNRGRTLVRMAVDQGSVETIEVLAQWRANVNDEADDEQTPMAVAEEQGLHDVVKTLVKLGAVAQPMSAHDSLSITSRANHGSAELMVVAARQGNADLIRDLSGRGVDVNERDGDGNTALMVAASRGHVAAVEALVQCGANCRVVNQRGNSPLMSAALNGHKLVCKILLPPTFSKPVLYGDIQLLDPRYVGEETGNVFGTMVTYLSEDKHPLYRVTIQNGRILDSAGKPFDTTTAKGALDAEDGYAIFVMDPAGDIYITNNHPLGKFHHSSFLAGAPVAAAGIIRIENGVVKSISRDSGHYKPNSIRSILHASR
jgi:ankyrin repeat protein